jgi:hypothetical protein
MTSPFDSPFSILCRRSFGIFLRSLTLQKLIECIDLAGNLAFGLQHFGFLGILAPKCNLSYQRNPQQALPFSKPCLLSYIVHANWLSRRVGTGLQEIGKLRNKLRCSIGTFMRLYFNHLWCRPQATNCNHFSPISRANRNSRSHWSPEFRNFWHLPWMPWIFTNFVNFRELRQLASAVFTSEGWPKDNI